MKTSISLLVFITLFANNARCQTFALNIQGDKAGPTTYSRANFVSQREHGRKACAITKIGIVSMGAGLVLLGLGVDLSLQEANFSNTTDQTARDRQQSATLLTIGAIVLAAGAGMTIGGVVHDISNRPGRRISVVAPGRNQLGLAYGF